MNYYLHHLNKNIYNLLKDYLTCLLLKNGKVKNKMERLKIKKERFDKSMPKRGNENSNKKTVRKLILHLNLNLNLTLRFVRSYEVKLNVNPCPSTTPLSKGCLYMFLFSPKK